MVKITIDVPDELAVHLTELEARLKRLEADKVGTEAPIPEADIDLVTAGIGLDFKRRLLQAVDIDAKRILIDRKPHTKVGRYQATYFAKEGPIHVVRSLYRPTGVRNAKTVDVVSARLGAVDGWLPNAAKAAAFLLQQGTSREAEATAQALGVLPYSRSSFERVAHEVGERFSIVRDDIEDTLIRRYKIPRGSYSISVSLDRVAVPFEEPRNMPEGWTPTADGPQRPIERAWHMAYVGTVTIHARDGEALHTIRYGRMPMFGHEDLVGAMTRDVKGLLKKRPHLVVVLITDGAQEMVDALDAQLSYETLGVEPRRQIDFWHVVEKLGSAAKVIHGPNAGPILKQWRLLLLNSPTAAARIRTELVASGKDHITVGQERPVHAAITYIDNQSSRMTFVAARAAGLPIGSGNVEATCKSLMGQRLVRTGSRWKEATAQRIVDLRALALSGRWDDALELTLQLDVHTVSCAA
ncbi:MAG: ISKra4 family transposase [Deltaproteobacteria bacterium]|nr:ISKra4 family transposase [Deltaproteobacteria bacterium]